VPALKTEQREWHHLESRENGSDGNNRGRRASATIARLPLAALTNPSRVKSSATTAVANTSKKPSTHRCTSHQRQYSIIEQWVF
jgi:hypothetical protein